VLADSGRFDEIVALLGEASHEDSRLAANAARFVGEAGISFERPGRVATLTRATPLDGFAARAPSWHGTGDGSPISLVAGEYVLRVALDAGDTLVTLVTIPAGARVERAIALPPADSTAARMRVVTAGHSPTGDTVAAFLIDRSEVTNADYQRFMNAGGYHDLALWPESMSVGGTPVPRADALARFTDRSGLPGPRFWTSGRPPEDQADHPVVGVTWYEAAAYAAWAGKSLATRAQWWRAALGEGNAIYPWGRDGSGVEFRANLDGRAARRRGSMPLGASPFGLEDMAGNAREWLADSTADGTRRIVVGGSWQDPSYMFERSHSESFSPGFSNDAIGFRLVRPIPRR
jgi:formylglycine-generating enzyme required for sulfatase activity